MGMTTNEAIEILIAVAVCDRPILSCDFCARYVGIGTHCNYPTDEEIEEAVLLLKGASNDAGISALRQQETVTKVNDLFDEDGGEIPLNAKTMTLDDAIAHLDDTLSDTGRKWSCESCRMEHVQLRAWLAELRDIKQESNAPLTLDELRQMDGEPVWVVYDEDAGMWALVEVLEESIFLTNNLGGRSEYAADVELEDDGITVYRQKQEEETV